MARLPEVEGLGVWDIEVLMLPACMYMRGTGLPLSFPSDTSVERANSAAAKLSDYGA